MDGGTCVQARKGKGLLSQPLVGSLSRVEVNHQQTAQHAHAIVVGKGTGKSNAIRHLTQVGLVFRPHALAQFLVVRFVYQYEAEQHQCTRLT
jgi:hypothetical protein